MMIVMGCVCDVDQYFIIGVERIAFRVLCSNGKFYFYFYSTNKSSKKMNEKLSMYKTNIQDLPEFFFGVLYSP